MTKLGKPTILLFVAVLTLSSLVLTSFSVVTDYPVFVDTSNVPRPSTPEFTISLADHSYNTDPITSSTTNFYNNKTTTTTIPSQHIKNFTVDLTIKNQPYPATIEGNTSQMFFFVRTKGHYTQDFAEDFQVVPFYVSDYSSFPNVMQSGSNYTVVSLPAEGYSVGDEIDFQVAAVLAYGCSFTRATLPPMTEFKYIRAATSNWSATQTFTMPDTTLNASKLSQTTSFANSDFTFLLIIAFIATITVSLALLMRKKKTKSEN
jgi:hypothetical protein